MTDKRTQHQAEGTNRRHASAGRRSPKRPKAAEGNMEKDPDDWTTGDEPMTGAQRSYLHTLAGAAHEEVPDELTKAEASKLIDRLREKTGRGDSEER